MEQQHYDQEQLRNLPALSELDDYDLANEKQDVRGRTLITSDGRRLGVIEKMLVDRDRERVAALVLDDGHAIPIEDVEIRDREVMVRGAADGKAPAGPAADQETAEGDELRVPLVEEELTVGKRAVESGHILVRSRVVEAPVSEQVRLRQERISVQERAVDQPVENAEALLREQEVEFTATSEEPVVAKRAKVKGEVVVRKDVDERTETIKGKVRHTEVDVEPPDDDTKH